jgi:RNA polymerase sigma factor (sigma-70 family)
MSDEAEATLEEVLRCAEPVMHSILGHFRRRGMLDTSDCEELASVVRLRLLMRLRRPEAEAISNIESYAARLTYNAVNDVFRGRHPRRTLLNRRLREATAADPRFELETTPRGVVCRLRGQSGETVAILAAIPPLPNDPGDAAEALLRAAGGPLLLNDVVAAVTLAHEQAARGTAIAEAHAREAAVPTPLARLERRQEMQRLWSEILLLPPAQRAALLLNLRADDGGNVIALFVLMRVTTFDALAEALGMSGEDLGAVWSELPLDDLTIAARLGVTRQQVINLRKSARTRLDRRYKRRDRTSE